jgi:hypothetical protein
MTKRTQIILFSIATMATPLFGQNLSTSQPAEAKPQAAELKLQAADTKSPAAPSADDMQKMMAQMVELSKLNDNHKLLGSLAGTWNCAIKSWMDPKAPPVETKGTANRKAIMDGRFYVADFNGTFKMPGADGKMKDMPFKGMSIEGYDNVKQKFFSHWIDSMGTGSMESEGTYDPATKTFTYTGEYEPMAGMKVKVREILKITDNDHHRFEMYEDRGQGEMKSMEISYSRKK